MFDSTAESIHKSSETRKVYSYQDKHVYYRDLVRWTGQVDLQLGLPWSWYSFQIETRFDWDQIFGRQVKGEGEKRFGCEALGARPGGTFFFHWGPDYTKVELSCLTAWPSDIFLTWPSYICLGQVTFWEMTYATMHVTSNQRRCSAVNLRHHCATAPLYHCTTAKMFDICF